MNVTEYLQTKSGIKQKKVPYYLQWISKYQKYCQGENKDSSIWNFQKTLINKFQDWQIEQAADAVKHYLYFQNHYVVNDTDTSHAEVENEQWLKENNNFKEVLRLKHRSLQTEKSYLRWRIVAIVNYPLLYYLTSFLG